jgi:hypothetical protein
LKEPLKIAKSIEVVGWQRKAGDKIQLTVFDDLQNMFVEVFHVLKVTDRRNLWLYLSYLRWR